MASALSTLVLQKKESEKLKPFQNPSRGAGLWGKPKTKTENWFTQRDLADASPLPPFAGRWSFCPISGCVRRPLEGDARGGLRLATVLVAWPLSGLSKRGRMGGNRHFFVTDSPRRP